MTDHSALAPLYRHHLDRVIGSADAALAASGYDTLIIASGCPRMHFLDDQGPRFQASPHFLYWLPLTEHPHCWIVHRPGHRPLLLYFQPADYWHLPPAAPEGFWSAHFEIEIHAELSGIAARLGGFGSACAVIAAPESAGERFGSLNPPTLLHRLHFARARKTEYELQRMVEASERAQWGHRAARECFQAGGSEFDIHLAYCGASAQDDAALPYSNIIALGQHGAVLHYQHRQRQRAAGIRTLLIDAGASADGYCSDITRTWTEDAEFQALIARMDRLQLDLVAATRPGRDYVDLHLDCHRALAELLVEVELVRCDADTALGRGLTRVFFPHGLGHLLGLQVHDIGGHQVDADGRLRPPPPEHPFLRLTRTLEPGFIVTIEPGLYFIPALLEPLRASADAALVDWSKVAALSPHGGIRIEDDVLVQASGPARNLSREAEALVAAAANARG